jgi:hypothetical protein
LRGNAGVQLVLVCRGRTVWGGSSLHCVRSGPGAARTILLFHTISARPPKHLAWYVPFLRYTRGLGWRIHCGVEVTESSTNKHHHQRNLLQPPTNGVSATALRFEAESSWYISAGLGLLYTRSIVIKLASGCREKCWQSWE